MTQHLAAHRTVVRFVVLLFVFGFVVGTLSTSAFAASSRSRQYRSAKQKHKAARRRTLESPVPFAARQAEPILRRK